MKDKRISETDSIDELAKFWDTHDLTAFEDQLEEVPELVSRGEPGARVSVPLSSKELAGAREERLARRREEDIGPFCRLHSERPFVGFEVESSMRVATGKVIDGKVVVEGEPLVEGSTVTVILPEPGEEVDLTAEEESRLAQAVREADEGDFLEEDAEQFLDDLDRRR